MKKFFIINGPNLNLLGQREPGLYGQKSLLQINHSLSQLAQELKVEVDFFQSNHEGELVEAIQKVDLSFNGAVLNAAAYTHTSVALRDAILAIDKPVIEVHLTNPKAREDFRHISFISGSVKGVISGFGEHSYRLALRYLAEQA
ncbi:MAG: type II 3-dehydroquinate dehydratase [Deltaproteobacteria bacterium]|jgi:3-dehydroquinate dehydratase-2|nr:type II 3-dehydroquinate dehydratase [Deltaproteobacteria bacterium]